jgi:predicted alpha/beta superfamily hydrolase
MPRIRAGSWLVCLSLCLNVSGRAQASQNKYGPGTAPKQDAPSQSEQPQTPTVPETKPLIDPKEPSVLGELDIITINSKVYKNIRNLRVWLPANYFAPVNRNKHYPVLYMQDGQNLFDEATAQYHEWKFDETVQFLTGSMRIHPMIVVGIDSTPRRANEYLPYPDPNNKELGKYETQDVHGKQYGDFVINEVMPLIEKKYRVLTGAHNTGLGGAMYGADAVLYTLMAHPGVFGKALLESPVLLVGNQELLKDAEKATQFPEKMYMAVGTAEEADDKGSAKNVEDVQELEKILRAKGLGPNRLDVVVEEGAKHDELAWSKRLQNALLFLYGSEIHLIPAK